MPHPAGSSSTTGDGVRDVASDRPSDTRDEDERHTVSELVRNFGDPPCPESQKRDRSESGDSAPAGKRGAMEGGVESGRSPALNRVVRECIEAAFDELESKMMVSISRDLHECKTTLTAEIGRLGERLRDLERHVEERDVVIAELTDELRHSREEFTALQNRVEEAEVNNRLPCLIVSGAAMAARHAPRLEPPLPTGSGQGRGAMTSQSGGRGTGAARGPGASDERGAARGGSGGRAGEWERERT